MGIALKIPLVFSIINTSADCAVMCVSSYASHIDDYMSLWQEFIVVYSLTFPAGIALMNIIPLYKYNEYLS